MNERETGDGNRAVSVPLDHRPAHIYFVSCERPDFPIKIGIATDLRKRLFGIQTTLPYEVVLLASITGTHRLERRLHRQFEEHRMRGEWFQRAPALMDAIERVKAGRRIQWKPELDPWSTPELTAHMTALRKGAHML